MTELKAALMSRGESSQEASEIINEMIDKVIEGENPEEVLYEEGLEPDYIFDIIG